VQRSQLTGQVAGLYVPQSGRLYVLGSGGAAPRSVIAHEVTHALQDEHFHLTRGAFAPHPRDHDGELAAQALVEGDATEVQSRYIATLSAGDVIGELGVLSRAPRNATVITTADSEIAVIGQRAMNRLLADAPGFARKLLEALANRVRELDRKLYP